jgi:hypothetical protein
MITSGTVTLASPFTQSVTFPSSKTAIKFTAQLTSPQTGRQFMLVTVIAPARGFVGNFTNNVTLTDSHRDGIDGVILLNVSIFPTQYVAWNSFSVYPTGVPLTLTFSNPASSTNTYDPNAMFSVSNLQLVAVSG